MGIIASIILSLICILAVIYALFIFYITLGLFLTKVEKSNGKKEIVSVSIVVAYKNEQENIVDCIKCLIGQSYDKNITEIILVDDYSTDNSSVLASETVRLFNALNIKLLSLEQMNIPGSKKNAIETAVNIASGKLIITTDADCRMSEKWVESVVDFYLAKKPKLILGPVRYRYTDSFFQKLQSLEFLSYIAAACGTAYHKKPILCNGANMAYEKELFKEIDPYRDNKVYKSGDDIFLLQKIVAVFGGTAVRFLKNKDSIVDTFPENDISRFFRQRVRWASKSKGYKDVFTVFSAYILFFYNTLLIAMIPFAFVGIKYSLTLLVLFLLKLIVDMPSYIMITKFSSQQKLIWYYLPMQIIYPFYISFVGIFSGLKKN